jgi:hypothetical protein
MTTTDLTVIDRHTGEIIDVEKADTERLAAFDAGVADLISELQEARGIVSSELVRRLDRSANWTLRVGDPKGDVQYEITAPSPRAGTTTYPPLDLERELRQLVERKVIDEAAAAGALERTVTLTLDVPLAADLDGVVRSLQRPDVTFDLDGATCKLIKADGGRKSRVQGINRLAKVPGTAAALDRVKFTEPVSGRRATIKPVRRKVAA